MRIYTYIYTHTHTYLCVWLQWRLYKVDKQKIGAEGGGGLRYAAVPVDEACSPVYVVLAQPSELSRTPHPCMFLLDLVILTSFVLLQEWQRQWAHT